MLLPLRAQRAGRTLVEASSNCGRCALAASTLGKWLRTGLPALEDEFVDEVVLEAEKLDELDLKWAILLLVRVSLPVGGSTKTPKNVALHCGCWKLL